MTIALSKKIVAEAALQSESVESTLSRLEAKAEERKKRYSPLVAALTGPRQSQPAKREEREETP